MKPPFKTKRARWGLLLLFLVGLYLLVILMIVPYTIKAPINQQLSRFDLQADYEHLYINPLTLNIHITQLQLNTKQQDSLLIAAEATIDWQLLPLINRTFNLDRLILQDADMFFEFDGHNNLIKPILPETPASKSPTNEAASTWGFEIGQVSVVNTNIHLKKGDQSYIIKQLNASHQPGLTTNQHPIDLRLRTDPAGQLTVVGGQQSKNGGWQMDWQLQNWPLTGLSDWFLASETNHISGDISAQGEFIWPPEQLPNITINQLDLTVEQAQFANLAVNTLEINAETLAINFNDRSLSLNIFNSPKAEWQLIDEPYAAFNKVLNILSDSEEQEQPWQWSLTELAIENWQLETTDRNGVSIFQVKRLKWQSPVKLIASEPQKNLTLEILTPNSEILQMHADVELKPLFLRGHVFTEQLDLSAFNALITPLSGWQLQQADIAIDSPFCYREKHWIMNDLGSTSHLTAANASQFITIKNFHIGDLLVDISDSRLYLNQVSADSGEGGEATASTPPSLILEPVKPPATDSAEQSGWQIFIGLPEQPNCQP